SVHPSELAAVIQTTSLPLLLLANPGFPATTVAEVIAQIRARPGTVSCGSSGSLLTVGCELLRWHARADMIMVPYKGQSLVLNALMAGEVNLMIDVVNTAGPQVKAGRARAIASLGPRRGGAFPDLPTVSETLPAFELVGWQGVAVPAATPRGIVVRLNREIGAVLEDPEIRRRIVDSGLEVSGGSVEAFEDVLRRDFAKYEKILKEAGIKPEWAAPPSLLDQVRLVVAKHPRFDLHVDEADPVVTEHRRQVAGDGLGIARRRGDRDPCARGEAFEIDVPAGVRRMAADAFVHLVVDHQDR